LNSDSEKSKQMPSAAATRPQSREGVRRPPVDEQIEREEYTFELLSLGFQKGEIKRRFRERFSRDGEHIGARTIERYLARARERLLSLTGKTGQEWTAESLAFYLAQSINPQARPREQILARERIDSLLGLDAPTRIAVQDMDAMIEKELARISGDDQR